MELREKMIRAMKKTGKGSQVSQMVKRSIRSFKESEAGRRKARERAEAVNNVHRFL